MGWSGSNNAGAEQRQLEAERQARIEQGRAAIDKNFEGSGVKCSCFGLFKCNFCFSDTMRFNIIF